jgi:hypothetical protein
MGEEMRHKGKDRRNVRCMDELTAIVTECYFYGDG